MHVAARVVVWQTVVGCGGVVYAKVIRLFT